MLIVTAENVTSGRCKPGKCGEPILARSPAYRRQG